MFLFVPAAVFMCGRQRTSEVALIMAQTHTYITTTQVKERWEEREGWVSGGKVINRLYSLTLLNEILLCEGLFYTLWGFSCLVSLVVYLVSFVAMNGKHAGGNLINCNRGEGKKMDIYNGNNNNKKINRKWPQATSPSSSSTPSWNIKTENNNTVGKHAGKLSETIKAREQIWNSWSWNTEPLTGIPNTRQPSSQSPS